MDVERIIKLIEEAEQSLKVLESISSLSWDNFFSDIRNRYTLRMAVVEVVESLVAASVRILREVKGEARQMGYVEVAKRLLDEKILAPSEADAFERLIRLRNIIIHRYWEVDDRRIYEEARGSGAGSIKRIIKRLKDYVLGSGGEKQIKAT